MENDDKKWCVCTTTSCGDTEVLVVSDFGFEVFDYADIVVDDGKTPLLYTEPEARRVARLNNNSNYGEGRAWVEEWEIIKEANAW